MGFKRNNIKVLLPLKKSISRPPINGWLGRKAFNRSKGRKFGELAELLDDNQFRAFCSAIGFVEVNWALMEQNLDRWVQLIFRDLEGVSIEKEPPMQFKRKAKFLRKAFNKIPQLSSCRDVAIDIINRAENLAETRNDLTHAVITSMLPEGSRYELENFKLNKDATHHIKRVTFDAKEFPALSLALVRLGRDALKVSAYLLDEFAGQDKQ